MNRSGNTGFTARLLWKQRGRAFSFGVAAGVLRESWTLWPLEKEKPRQGLDVGMGWFEPGAQTALDKFV